MKKSKFMQNSKDMLSRSFNPAKCKTSLKLAASRLKLLRNKKEAQVKQMKRELAQLLESGNTPTARIRVEHVIREDKMMAAYDLIELYCELTVARMPVIESQKNCPIDLKEAITSLIFASPRCGDVPELVDVRKHLTAKYGKDFTTAAIELRPECGVSRLLVEKLSAIAPDGQTKLKLLTAIAEEHNVKWDPNSFGEKDGKPPNDLLSGPSTFEKSSAMHAETHHFEASHSLFPPVDNKTHSSLNVPGHDHRSSLGNQNSTSSQSSDVSSAVKHEVRPQVVRDERVQSAHEDPNSYSKQRWNMEFKDATSAAQAAAESAELASRAARAAAELSRQHSPESHKLDAHISRNDRPERSTSQFSSENFPDYSANIYSDQIGHNNLNTAAGRLSEDGYVSAKRFSETTSFPSRTSPKNSFKEVNKDEINMKKPNVGEVSMKKHTAYDAESGNGWQEKSENFEEERFRKDSSHMYSRSHSSNSGDENIFANYEQNEPVYDAGGGNEWPQESENFPEERIARQPGRISSYSHPDSSIFSNENIFANAENQNLRYDAVEDPLVGNRGRFDEDSSRTNPHDLTSAVFDKSDSDNDEYGFGFDMGRKYDEPEADVHFSSPGKKSPKFSPVRQDAWSPRTSSIKLADNSTSSVFLTEEHQSPEISDNIVPMAFDDSNGSDSDSDGDIDKFDPNGKKESINLISRQNKSPPSVRSSFKEGGYSGFDRKQWSLLSDDEADTKEVHMESNRGDKFDSDSPKIYNSKKPSANPPSLGSEKFQLESDDSGDELNSESGMGLKFGKLTGGFRHKGNNPPPYLRSRLDSTLPLKKTAEDTLPEAATPPTVESSKLSAMLDDKKSTRGRDSYHDMDNDSSDEEVSQKDTSGRGRGSFIRKGDNAVKKKSNFGVSIFGSDDSDLDEDVPQQSVSKKTHLQSGLSRRTKASYTKSRLDSDSGNERKLSTSYSTEAPQESQSQTRPTDKRENLERPTSSKVASKPVNSSFSRAYEHSTEAKSASTPTQESKTSRKSSDVEQSSKPQPVKESAEISKTSKPTLSNRKSSDVEQSSKPQPVKESAEISKTSKPTLSKTYSNNEDVAKRASHVHPKLPDYDTLPARLQALWQNHQ